MRRRLRKVRGETPNVCLNARTKWPLLTPASRASSATATRPPRRASIWATSRLARHGAKPPRIRARLFPDRDTPRLASAAAAIAEPLHSCLLVRCITASVPSVIRRVRECRVRSSELLTTLRLISKVAISGLLCAHIDKSPVVRLDDSGRGMSYSLRRAAPLQLHPCIRCVLNTDASPRQSGS